MNLGMLFFVLGVLYALGVLIGIAPGGGDSRTVLIVLLLYGLGWLFAPVVVPLRAPPRA